MSGLFAKTPDGGSEADRMEQQMPAAVDSNDVDEPDDLADEAGSLRVGDSEASEGDLIDQALPVPLDEEEDRS